MDAAAGAAAGADQLTPGAAAGAEATGDGGEGVDAPTPFTPASPAVAPSPSAASEEEEAAGVAEAAAGAAADTAAAAAAAADGHAADAADARATEAESSPAAAPPAGATPATEPYFPPADAGFMGEAEGEPEEGAEEEAEGSRGEATAEERGREATLAAVNVDDWDTSAAGKRKPATAGEGPADDFGSWSWRTRGAAKFLQHSLTALAEQQALAGEGGGAAAAAAGLGTEGMEGFSAGVESVRSQPSVSLLAVVKGRPRREAARMFFETLVLKTRDYIQVQQTEPYGDISITAQTPLMQAAL
ncbi:hypothetical protein CLOM_g14506 [Closterium sp. NIES-68]|nr:hypothetical protein CLOM_g14506 [Closterium sp. NIES-68]